MPKLSIFMPVYNAGKYLEQAIESVLNQEFKDFDFYIHDDGSTDGSYEVCQEYAKTDKRIILDRGENLTTNVRQDEVIRITDAVYIAFIDHDDYMDKSYLKDMVNKLEKTDADMAVSSYTLVASEGEVLNWYTPTLKDGELLTGADACRRFLISFDIEGFRWNKVYRRSLIVNNDIKYQYAFPGDIAATFRLIHHADKVVMVGSKGYYYRQSAGSQVGGMNQHKLKCFIERYEDIGEYARKCGFEREGEYYQVWRTINSLYNAYGNRHRYSGDEWESIRKEYGIRKTTGKRFADVVAIVLRYKGSRDSRVKFFVKTVIVGAVYR